MRGADGHWGRGFRTRVGHSRPANEDASVPSLPQPLHPPYPPPTAPWPGAGAVHAAGAYCLREATSERRGEGEGTRALREPRAAGGTGARVGVGVLRALDAPRLRRLRGLKHPLRKPEGERGC